MNPRLFLTCLCFSGLALSGCNKSEPEGPAAPASKVQAARPVEPPTPAPPLLPAGPSESEKKLAQQVREMQTRQLELELKLEDEKLARTEAEIAKERDLLEQERVAWNREQELAVARLTPPASDESSLPVTTGPGGDYQMFYDDLAPLGSWYDCEDYGYVWQPAVCITDNTWRPYTLGSWANCDQGWAWCSDEPFGWACYHYGRWAKVRGRGWVWVPGDQWAPCWVSWRRNDNYIGWCPLPPETVYNRDCTYGPTVDIDCGIHPGCYVFMPVKHFDRPCRNYCEAPPTCLTICSTTVCITNITVRPGRVDCHGPKYDWIKDCVRRPVPRFTLDKETEFAGRGHRGPRLEKDKMHVFAPKVQAPWNTHLRPARHAALDTRDFVRAESGLPDKLASRFRAEKQERVKEVEGLKGNAKAIAERQQRLAGLEQARESLREQRVREKAIVSAPVPGSATAPAVSPERSERPQSRPGKQVAGDAPSSRALPVPETTPFTAPGQPGREDVTAGRDQAAAQRNTVEPSRKEEAASRREVAANDKDRQDEESTLRAALEDQRRQQNKGSAFRTQPAAQPAMVQPPRAGETVALDDSAARDAAASRELEKQAALRAQLEERRRQQQAARNDQNSAQASAQRTALEQRRASEAAGRNESASRELDKQSAIRAAQEQQRRTVEAEARAEQQARQREAMEQQRAANEQQRRQADAEARAEQQRRQAEEMQRRQAEVETRQRQAQEEQRRNAEEQQQRRQAEESQRRQAEAESRQRDMEQRRQAEEQQQRRQAEERAKEATEQQRRQAENQDREERGRGKR